MNNKIEDICIGSLQAHAAIKTDGVCTTLTSAMGMGGGQTPMILIDAIPCASRGRYQKDGSTEQQLEIHNDGISNAITTVGKDSYVIEEYKSERDKNFAGGQTRLYINV